MDQEGSDMRPTLRQIEYFVAVAQCGSFGAAAKSLAVSQPSLSKQLATMEDHLGCSLIERTSRRVTLTPLGRRLLALGQEILRNADEFRSVAAGAEGLFGGRLSIGVLPSVGAYFMPIANRRLHKLFPDLRLAVQEGTTSQLLDLLRDGNVDAVVGTPTNAPNVQSIQLFSETLWVCAAGDDPLSEDTEPVTLAELQGRPFLTLGPGFTLHDTAQVLAAKAGTYVSRDYQSGSLDAVRQMSVMGAGIAVLPSLYALAEAVRDPEFVVRRIDDEEAKHDIALHWRRSSQNSSDFIRLAQELKTVKRGIVAARDDRFRTDRAF